eukprot:TRINITY_DN3192_c0_g2_i1.p1 TRINITY_DN3192_c0_g2~~TRINITY_DN3192_c0_g2_i1.p1  ORF type:complete len:771 (+),score=171.65 TRINITY_DN3192_c0_g2_i1:99-2411(+)
MQEQIARHDRLRAKIIALKESAQRPQELLPTPADLPSLDDWHARVVRAAAERRKSTSKTPETIPASGSATPGRSLTPGRPRTPIRASTPVRVRQRTPSPSMQQAVERFERQPSPTLRSALQSTSQRPLSPVHSQQQALSYPPSPQTTVISPTPAPPQAVSPHSAAIVRAALLRQQAQHSPPSAKLSQLHRLQLQQQQQQQQQLSPQQQQQQQPRANIALPPSHVMNTPRVSFSTAVASAPYLASPRPQHASAVVRPPSPILVPSSATQQRTGSNAYAPPILRARVGSGSNSTHEQFLYDAMLGDADQLERTIAAVPDVFRATCDGWSALHFASACVDGVNAVAVLIAYGMDANIRTTLGVTPMHIACSHGHTRTVAVLLRAGASVTLLDQYGCLALHRAAACGSLPCAIQVVSVGMDVVTRDLSGKRPADVAIAGGHRDLARVLQCFGREHAAPSAKVPIYDSDADGAFAVAAVADSLRAIGNVRAATRLYRSALSSVDISWNESDPPPELPPGAGLPPVLWGLACCALWENDIFAAGTCTQKLSLLSIAKYFSRQWSVQGALQLMQSVYDEAERYFDAALRSFAETNAPQSTAILANWIGQIRCCSFRDNKTQLASMLQQARQLIPAEVTSSSYPLVKQMCTDDAAIVLCALTGGRTDPVLSAGVTLVHEGYSQIAAVVVILGLCARNATSADVSRVENARALALIRAVGLGTCADELGAALSLDVLPTVTRRPPVSPKRVSPKRVSSPARRPSPGKQPMRAVTRAAFF